MFLLGVVAGDSVYAIGLMLATFLLGLGLGSAACQALARTRTRAATVTLGECGIALALTATVFLWNTLPNYFASLGYAVASSGGQLDFGAREFIRALVCMTVMLPPAFFIGLSYPAVMALAAHWLAGGKPARQGATGVGLSSGIHTVGSLLGMLLAGFVLLPAYGSLATLRGLAAVAELLAAIMFAAECLPSLRDARRMSGPPGDMGSELTWFIRAMPAREGRAIVLALLGLLIWPGRWDYTALSTTRKARQAA